MLSRLKHKNIVEFIDHVSSKKSYYFVFELCKGGDLRSLLQQKGRLTEDEAQRIFKQLADALCVLNMQDIVHRDLKPANILLTADGQVKLADFGLAKFFHPKDGLLESKVGTPYYLAPEILEGSLYDSKADLWSVGIILF